MRRPHAVVGARRAPARKQAERCKLRLVAEGQDGIVAMVILPDGTCPAEQFFDSLSTQVQARLQHRFDKVAHNRMWRHPQHFKQIEGTDMFEFKKHQARFPCFWTRRKRGCLVITHGVSKKQDKLASEDVARAFRIRQMFDRGE